MIWIPTVKAVEDAHYGVVAMFENEEDPVSPAGVKSAQMLESACMRPHTGVGDQDKYKTVYKKMAALFHSLTKNHPFHNGNKRTAVVTLLSALHRNNRRLRPEVTDDILYEFAVDVTADHFPEKNRKISPDEAVDAIAVWLKINSMPVISTVPGMKVSDFIQKCKIAGVRYKEVKGGLHCLQNAGGSVTIKNTTRHMDGPVVKEYIKRLRLHEIEGVGVDEFTDGTNGEREQIYRYMATLKRLAKT